VRACCKRAHDRIDERGRLVDIQRDAPPADVARRAKRRDGERRLALQLDQHVRALVRRDCPHLDTKPRIVLGPAFRRQARFGGTLKSGAASAVRVKLASNSALKSRVFSSTSEASPRPNGSTAAHYATLKAPKRRSNHSVKDSSILTPQIRPKR
jgi:hypothetical protein